MNNLLVDKASLSKIEEIYTILLRCSDETDYLACSSRERVDSGTTLESFREFIHSSPSRGDAFFVLLREDRVIGMLGMHREQRKRFSHRISLGMNILKDYWGTGGGSLLLKEAVKAFHLDDSLTKLELEVRTDNLRAVSLYEKFGFQIEAEIRNHFLVGSSYYSVYRMSLFKEDK